jgi:hypothetical protein
MARSASGPVRFKFQIIKLEPSAALRDDALPLDDFALAVVLLRAGREPQHTDIGMFVPRVDRFELPGTTFMIEDRRYVQRPVAEAFNQVKGLVGELCNDI